MKLKNATHPPHGNLPSVAKSYLKNEDPSGCSIITSFHRWMERYQLRLQEIRPHHLDKFLRRPRKRKLKKQTQAQYRIRLRGYLYWLFDKGCLKFDPDRLRKHPKKLPDIALQFIGHLTPTHKQGTVNRYRSTLRKFYGFLDRENIDPHLMTRTRMAKWLKNLYEEGLHPSTRLSIIFIVRKYLEWLHDQNQLRELPDYLIRKTDLPKLPSYLPRPLPPEDDRKLQQYLSQSTQVHHQGLLLMRKTGLRIGELMDLPYNCVHQDYRGNRSLKVPLGKLNNERLVPIDDTTHQIIKKIKATHQYGKRKKWLLQTSDQRKTDYWVYQAILRDLAQKLNFNDSLGSHRLRHTYATEMLNAGMSLVGVMRLLGHRDFRMTLRYAAITQETVGKEYFQAMKEIKQRYTLPKRSRAADFNPLEALTAVTKWLYKTNSAIPAPQKKIRLLLKRIDRLKNEIKELEDYC